MSVAKRLVRPLIALAVAAVAVVGPAVPAQAADNGAWSVTPTPADDSSPTPRSYFVLEGAPGATLTDKVRIRNFTKRALTFSIYGADGYNTTEGGFFALRGLEFPQKDVGAWVTVPVQTVKVAKKTQVDVPITIRIPDNATPGDHVGGIVALNGAVEGTTEADGLEVGLKRAVAARLYLRVSGPTMPAVEVTDIELEHDRGALGWTGSSSGTVSYTVTNTGNLRLSPQSVITLSGLPSRELDAVESAGVVDLLPGQSARLNAEVEGIGPFDRVTTTVTLTTAEGIGDVGETTTWVVPWVLIAVVLALLALGAWWWLHRRAERRRAFEALENAPTLTVSAGR
ncbi:uncharacterized protein DUF916 [Mumia flava]|uniref:Uncharacterized protein DUF916 n=1 Tax=Mumia flava TaxID=1348852 RepID=A0A2M9BEH7_9ACTN|nr:DUF916 domain-containing protein [Mumia flava]PJJ56357.1 uncharacterized protein DUF916 [Mumia flava]